LIVIYRLAADYEVAGVIVMTSLKPDCTAFQRGL